ncbi:hypothetical protein [Bacillus suaedaesalsae]|uniref:Uncharacterized protein n=1 Tax=Bacillus suaedaesalsae TaxID=2810349 RepID=A0ABS2DKD6_9BACI|nr:hypothetical protein [Bacillus suaedaesalsae]MBM6617923.1 hypothetical protein [Bacillus suaedaesalsae]
MDKHLHRLKESMDDTVLKDIQMNQKLKGKILKDISNENTNQQVRYVQKKWNVKTVFASIAALFLLFVIGSSILNSQTSGYNEKSQQVELLKLHSEIVSTLKSQVRVEKELIEKINSKDYTIDEINKLKVKAAKNSLEVSKEIGSMRIPETLNMYKPELKESLYYLRKSYMSRSNELMKIDQWVRIQINEELNYPRDGVESDLSFFQFEFKIYRVYEKLGLLRSSYLTEIQTTSLINIDSFHYFSNIYK